MKAIIIKDFGDTDVLEVVNDFPEPEVGPNDVLVEIKARSLNRIEIVVRNGYPGIPVQLPHIPGPDGAGIIKKTGTDVKDIKEGDRVVVYPVVIENEDEFTERGDAFLSPLWKYVGLQKQGTYAELVAIPETSVVKIPDNIDFAEASTLPTAGLTAYHGVKNVGKLKEGEYFLIWGATGGVGTFAIQIAKLLGGNVIAVTSKPDKVSKLKELGADHVIDSSSEDVMEKVKEITDGKGLDMVLDYVGPATFDTSFNMLKKGGRILLCGQLTGRETMFSIHMTYFKHISILGFYLGSREEMKEFIQLVSDGKVKPVIFDKMPMEKIKEAHNILENSDHFGKIVIE